MRSNCIALRRGSPSLEPEQVLRGLLAEGAFNSNTIHPAIIEFKGQWYILYHNGSRQRPDTGNGYRRSVCIDYLYRNPNGSIRRIAQTTEGLSLPLQP